MRSLSLSTCVSVTWIAGRTRWYASSLHGTTVLSPSLPPPIWMTTSTLSGSTPFANGGSSGELAGDLRQHAARVPAEKRDGKR